MNIKELIKEYREIRDELDIKRKVYMAFEKESKEQLLHIETQMLDISNQTGVDSFKTVDGTVFRATKTYARLSAGEDAKELRIAYAKASNDFGLFTSHVNKTHAKELLDEGLDLTSAGIDWIEEATMQVRKPTN